MAEMNIDPSLITEFLDESGDLLSALDSEFLKLEQGADKEAIQAIFRPVHSIKGNSSFFGFFGVKKLSHEMETVLDRLRKDKIETSPALVTLLLRSLDMLKAMLVRLRKGENEVSDAGELSTVVDQLSQAAGGEDKNALLHEARTQLERIGQSVQPEQEVLRRAWVNLRDVLRKLLPGLRPTETRESADVAQHVLSLVAKYREMPPPDEGCDDLLVALQACEEQAVTEEAKSACTQMLDTYETITTAMGFDVILLDVIEEQLRGLAGEAFNPSLTGKAPSEPPADSADRTAPPSKACEEKASDEAVPTGPTTQEKTMRVAESQIDQFLAFVGELLVVGDMFEHILSRLHRLPEAREEAVSFKRANETFSALSDQLRNSIMNLRKVPARGLLQKVPRLVRDVASASGKRIKVTVLGEDILIDKSQADLLDAPLTHMVRNAADHGIEAPGTRTGAGKPEEGRVTVSMEETESSLVLKVVDDGGGLNINALQKKAAELGLIAADSALREEDVVSLLFSSGVSTAAEVTDVSGRGVGMDVVRRQVEGAGGSIHVETSAGKGSTFRVHLPKSVTTQIISGYLVEVCGECLILPMDKVQETARVGETDITSVSGKGRCVTRHGRILRALDLAQCLDMGSCRTAPDGGALVVIVERHSNTIALQIDSVLGVQQVVLRPIEGLHQMGRAISAAALRGDGSVALVLDVDKLDPE